MFRLVTGRRTDGIGLAKAALCSKVHRPPINNNVQENSGEPTTAAARQNKRWTEHYLSVFGSIMFEMLLVRDIW